MRRFVVLALLAALGAPALASVSSSTTSSGPYDCDGVTTAYVIGFRFLESAHVVATRTLGGVSAVLSRGPDYTVTSTSTGGTLTLVAGSRCPVGATLALARVTPRTQPTVLSAQGVNPKALEGALDRQSMVGAEVDNTHAVDKAAQATRDTAQDVATNAVEGKALAAVGALNTDTHALSDLASVLAFGSLTPRTVSARFADVVNVMDHGCVGNGVADDLPCFDRAVAALPAFGGRIFIPRPSVKYRLAGTWVINKRAVVEGSGFSESSGTAAGSVIFKAATVNAPAIRIAAGSVVLRDLLVQGEAGNGGDGISIEAGRASLENVASYGMGQDGIRIGLDTGGNSNLWHLSNVRSKANGRHGLHVANNVGLGAGPNANAGTLTHGDFQGNTGDGIFLGHTGFNTFAGLATQTNTECGVHLSPEAYANIFLGGDIEETNGLRDMTLESGSHDNLFFGPFVRVNSSRFSDLGSNNVVIARGDTGLPSVMRGLYKLSLSRNSTNYIAAESTGGAINFVVNGEAATDAETVLKLNANGTVRLGKPGDGSFTVANGAYEADRDSANYFRASVAGGYLNFVVNGEDHDDAHSVLKLGVDGKLHLGKLGTATSGSFAATVVSLGVTSIAANTCSADVAVNVPFAAVGAPCFVGLPATITAGIQGSCHVTSTNWVALRLCNNGSAPSDPPNDDFAVRVFNP